MRMVVLSLAAALAAAGCTTMTPEQQRAADEAECRDYGFRARNDAFAECLQRLELDRRASRRATRAALDYDPFPRTQVIYVPRPRPAG